MSPERTWIRPPLFWAKALLTVFIDFLSWPLSFPAVVVCIEGKSIGNIDVTVPGARQSDFTFATDITAIDLASTSFARSSGRAAIQSLVMIGF
jgi:hypothetical protein